MPPQQKAYQNLVPFEDPEKEKKRQNAIKAKEARDRKNAEVLGLKKTIEKLQRIKRKQRKSLDHYKIILKSHNIRNPVEESFDEDSDSDMEIMESNVKMIKSQKESGNDLGMENTRQTSEPVVRFVLKPVTQDSPPIFSSEFSSGPNVNVVSPKIEAPKATPVSEPVNKVWGNGLAMETSQPTTAQAGEIFSSGFTTGPKNVSQEIPTPKATESNFEPESEQVKKVWGNGFEPASEPFSLDNVIMENLIKNADVIIDESFSIGESSANVPLVQNSFGNPMETVSHHMDDLKTIDPKGISSPSRDEPENLNKVDNFNIFNYMNVWNNSPQID
jgi:hypothetical protein